MPDDPIQDNQVQTTSQPEPTPEEVKPVEGNTQPEEPKVPEPPKEETSVEIPTETSKEEPKPEEKTPEESKPEDSRPQEPEIKIVEKEIIKEVPVEVIKEVKVVDEEEVKKQVSEKLKEKLLENKKKADETRTQRRKDNLNKIIDLAKKKEINNLDVRDLLQVSQSTATNYLTELAKSGRLKSEKKAKATIYRS